MGESENHSVTTTGSTGSTATPERSLAPLVALGASAGGLEALQELFRELPVDTGIAFVVIQHLDPVRPSMLASVLANETTMPVIEIADGMRAEGNRVHVIPPGSDIGVRDGVFRLLPRETTRKLHLPIDTFFAALAEDEPGRAIGVVLSGTGSDGTLGLRAIKAAGGITFAQEPESAQFPGMPESAVAGGAVDFRLAPREIAREIVRLSRHPYVAPRPSVEAGEDEQEGDAVEDRALGAVLAEVRRHTQRDFTGYKRPTIRRRIARRMALRRLETVQEYARSLHHDPAEASALAEDILIHVTSFFRDAAVFEALEQRVFPELLGHKENGATVRCGSRAARRGKRPTRSSSRSSRSSMPRGATWPSRSSAPI